MDEETHSQVKKTHNERTLLVKHYPSSLGIKMSRTQPLTCAIELYQKTDDEKERE